MGILNLTPDSFYAPSRLLKEDGNPDAEAVVARAQAMVADGATVLDLGACSTRPGFTDVGAEEEWRRLGPVLRPLRDALPDVILSIDTYQPEVVRRVFDAIGPFWVNDVSARPDMICAAASLGLPYIAMHGFTEPDGRGGMSAGRATYPQVPWSETGRQTTPDTAPESAMADAVLRFFEAFAEEAERKGLEEWMVDPGFGFGKTLEQNYEVFRDLERLQSFGRRILVGISRKSMIYKLLGCTPDEALPASLSKPLIDLLRGPELNYDGLLITDALSMGAVTQRFSPGEAAVLAFAAGNDLLLVSDHLNEAYEAVLRAVEDGTIPTERLDESVLRILRAKEALQ